MERGRTMRIAIPDSAFVEGASLPYEIECTLLDAANERHTARCAIDMDRRRRTISLSVERGMLSARMFEEGRSVGGRAPCRGLHGVGSDRRARLGRSAVACSDRCRGRELPCFVGGCLGRGGLLGVCQHGCRLRFAPRGRQHNRRVRQPGCDTCLVYAPSRRTYRRPRLRHCTRHSAPRPLAQGAMRCRRHGPSATRHT